jgi:two-component system OmpR family sensor kinase
VSLRARLTLILIALAAVGLVASDIVSYTSMRTFLQDRADASLDSSVNGLTATLEAAKTPYMTPEEMTIYAGAVIPGQCILARLLNGKVVASRCVPESGNAPRPTDPVYPEKISLPAEANAPDGERVAYFTVPSKTGEGRYRVRASVLAFAPGFELLVATPLTGSDATLHRLFLIELFVTAFVLAILAVVGLWAVGVGLRPLDAISRTAGEIARGDLFKRVERINEKTEIGRLGRVLNTMLGQIETSFQAREASERRVRQFVADASHELRTPLAAVRAYAELFSRGAATRPDDLERSMQGVKRESERMSALVDELTLLAHLDEGQPLGREPVDFESVVAEAVETARAVDPERPIALTTEPAIVDGDRTRLRQIVDNLLANVRAHTPPETPVEVTLGITASTAVLSVTDSGPGIDAGELPQVFERFYRADISRSRARGGAGLGLSIVAAIAEAHGGSATVSSEPGSGATFTITLPRIEAEPEPESRAEHDGAVESSVA